MQCRSQQFTIRTSVTIHTLGSWTTEDGRCELDIRTNNLYDKQMHSGSTKIANLQTKKRTLSCVELLAYVFPGLEDEVYMLAKLGFE